MRNDVFRKTRLAPTPSGYLHLGNILSFAITAALARRTGAKILLRIDDADRERTNKLYVQEIFDTLNFLEIPWDEGPRNLQEYEQEYSQVHRMDMYRTALAKLKETGEVFACTCSRTDVARLSAESIYTGTCRDEHLSLDSANTSWRLRTYPDKEIEVKTLAGITKAKFPESMQDFIVKKRDGFPAYQLTSLIDDVYYEVDLVVRGEDLWPSTLAQLYLSSVIGQDSFRDTTFYHHPLVVDTAGKKLSKSEGATSVHYLRKDNKTASDIYAMVAAMANLKGIPGTWEQLVDGFIPYP